MPKSLFMIVDGHALLYRAWHAIPPLTTSSGIVVNAAYGFTSLFMKALKELKPTYVAVAFDRREKTFRHEAYKEYKAQRVKQPDEFYRQCDFVKDILTAFGTPFFEKAGFEADDVIATLCHIVRNDQPDVDIIIVTGDMDTLQLVDEHTKVYTLKRGISDTVTYGSKEVHERYGGLEPEELLTYKALRGDPSDNIPGVKGVGEKTALDLVRRFKTLEALYLFLEKKQAKKGGVVLSDALREKLLEKKDDAFASRNLVDLIKNVPLSFTLEKCRVGAMNQKEVVELFQKFEFRSLLPRLTDLEGAKAVQPSLFEKIHRASAKKNYHCISNEKECSHFLSLLKKESHVAVDTETTSIHALDAKLIGMSFSWKEGEAWYVAWNVLSKKQRESIAAWLKDEKIKKIGHNIKYDMEVFAREGIALGGLFFDTMIAAYLLNPGVRGYSLDALAFTEFGYQKIAIESLIGKKGKDQKSMADVPLEHISEYACEDADFTWRLYERFEPKLREQGVTNVFYDIEMPLVPLLADMEEEGIRIDGACITALAKKVRKNLKQVEKKIFSLAGEEFNISSPLQLKKILFEKLTLSSQGLRKKKTGLSTAAGELEKMRGSHPIIEPLLEYRELSKLLNTYLDVFPSLILKETGRVHTSFNQTITSTGRLSSSEPNLQNIPIRNEWGSEIRRCFVAEKGYRFLSADYSQLELRIIAALSGDEKMIKAFHNGQDIHTTTAAEIHGVPPESVTKEMRRAAKEINFGILYGMGANSLAEHTGVSYTTAQKFIDRYFSAYPKVKLYLDDILTRARTQGYVETFFGRRRYVPEVRSSVHQIRLAAERMAQNAPIQGTEADVIKLAMIAVSRRVRKKYGAATREKVRLLLQVHDELLFEVREEFVEEVAQILKEEMEGVVQLAVPLTVDLHKGLSWGEMKSI